LAPRRKALLRAMLRSSAVSTIKGTKPRRSRADRSRRRIFQSVGLGHVKVQRTAAILLIAPPMSLRPGRRYTSQTQANDRAREANMAGLLDGKTAIIYGGGGGIGGGVARTFAREGARVFLAGRTKAALDEVAKGIKSAGGSAEVTTVDALDEQAVDRHVEDVVSKAGRVDISFNLITRGDVQGVPLVEMKTDDLLRAVTTGLRGNFITARAAGRKMIEQGSGAILHLNSASGDAAMPGMGSTGPADAATESFMRYLAAELGPHGIRVCGIWTAGVIDTLSEEKMKAVNENVPGLANVSEMLANMSVLRRNVRLADVAEAAAFLASDRAAGITGTMLNVTSGLVLK
jgi:NAD(P)-dependent dehydrogenase (short-subunit alcohol dehydrogenase family)